MPSEPSIEDDTLHDMVAELQPTWSVEKIDRVDEGTDLVAILTVRTPTDRRQAVLKVATAEHVPEAAARAEPRFLERAGTETAIPVPTVEGYCDAYDAYPAPFFLTGYVDGENYERRIEELDDDAQERVIREAARHLAALHELGPTPGRGRLGYRDGQFEPIEPTDAGPLEGLLADVESNLSTLTAGGYFPDLADEPERFADLVSPLRAVLRERIPALSEPEAPTYCHADYRYGNLLLDPETGETTAVLDWGQISGREPVFNLAYTECMLVDPERDGETRAESLRSLFRRTYEAARPDWRLDEERRERMAIYQLCYRIDAMACLPLWVPDPEDRDERERIHREFVAQYL